MRRAPSATVLAVVLLFVCPYGSAEDRTASSSQRYRIHVPAQVKFGQVQLPPVTTATKTNATADAASLSFMAETTSGLTIQFETQSATPLQLTVDDSERGNWWANQTQDSTRSTRELVVEATSVQATTLRAGRTTLTLGVADAPASDATVPTVVVTIVAH